MSIRSERIKALVDNSGLSYQELEKLTGIKKSSLQRYASGVTTKIPLDVIEKLSKAFHISQKYLMGWDEKETPDQLVLTGVDKELYELLMQIPEEQKKLFLEMGRVFVNNLNKG